MYKTSLVSEKKIYNSNRHNHYYYYSNRYSHSCILLHTQTFTRYSTPTTIYFKTNDRLLWRM